MTPAARTAALIDILGELARAAAPADAVLQGWFRARRYAGSGDRRAIREAVYDVLRARELLHWALAAAGADPDDPRNLALAHTVCLARSAPEPLFAGGTYAPDPLNEAETRLAARLAGLDRAAAPPGVWANCPDWLWTRFAAQWGVESAARELAALNDRAPVDLRVNALRATREEARASLAADGWDSTPTPLSPLGLRGQERTSFANLAAFRDGLVDIQDEASQLVAAAVDARPGMTVVDLCAGAGGKTLALAAAMEDTGTLVAMDVSARRLDRMRPRLDRAGVSIVRMQPGDAAEPPPDLLGKADRVLVDAPCSGTGTWRRAPELRRRLTPEALEEYSAAQAALLAAGASLVRSGGWLVYATCSVLDAENSGQVDAFLSAHPDFARVPAAGVSVDVRTAAADARGDLRFTPARHGTDGLYAAVLERRA